MTHTKAREANSRFGDEGDYRISAIKEIYISRERLFCKFNT